MFLLPFKVQQNGTKVRYDSLKPGEVYSVDIAGVRKENQIRVRSNKIYDYALQTGARFQTDLDAIVTLHPNAAFCLDIPEL